MASRPRSSGKFTPPALPPRPTSGADERWLTILENLEEGIVAVDCEGRITHMNQSAEHLAGRSRSSARGRSHRWVFRNSPWISELIESVAGARQNHIRAQGEIDVPWGRPSLVLANASPLLDAMGVRLGAVVVLHDLTLQRSLESDQQRTQSLDQFGTFVAGLAHEIKNPLSGIRGAVQLLDADLEPGSRGGEYVALVLREVDRLTRLLEHLLHLGTRGAIDEHAAVNVHQIVDHVLAVVRPAAERDGVTLVRLYDPSLPAVAGHPDELTQVFLNLTQNALQALAASPPGSPRHLRISTRMETEFLVASERSPTRRRSRFLRIEVEDDGPGIPSAAQARLFSPFFTTKAKGTGLGLAISHRIVADHQGTIRFESEPGRTVFRVILPVWEGTS